MTDRLFCNPMISQKLIPKHQPLTDINTKPSLYITKITVDNRKTSLNSPDILSIQSYEELDGMKSAKVKWKLNAKLLEQKFVEAAAKRFKSPKLNKISNSLESRYYPVN